MRLEIALPDPYPNPLEFNSSNNFVYQKSLESHQQFMIKSLSQYYHIRRWWRTRVPHQTVPSLNFITNSIGCEAGLAGA